MKEAEGVHASGRGLFYNRDKAQEKLDELSETLALAQRKKSLARRAFALVERSIDELEQTYGIDASNAGALLAGIEKEQNKMASFLRYIQNKRITLVSAAPEFGISVAQHLLHTSLGEITDMHIRSRAVTQARLRIFETVLTAKKLSEQSSVLAQVYENELEQYEAVWQEYLQAKGELMSAENRIAEVQRITEEVQGQITALQRELARIDAKLVARLERELIEKGLMSAQPGERSDGRIRSTQAFHWPVVGRISAGFHNASYKQFFGVAHKGIDIVVPQGTPVLSAADGVVYLARDGGQYGYSYVLVGHRNGYATLYGHLNSIAVKSGQEISAAQMVGSSGGTPGTYGAGPMTTGAHLHFEVIKNGTHVDPHTILP